MPALKVHYYSKNNRMIVSLCSAFVLMIATGAAFGFGGGGGGFGGGGSTTEPNFTLDFTPDTNSDGSFGWGGGGGGFGGGSVGNDDTRTVFLQEGVGGYVHQLIGSPDDDFAQDVYIQNSGCCNTSMNDPFGRGTGGANPTRVVMRQRVMDGESVNEFLKDSLNTKPLITSTVDDGELLINTVIDMRAITYQDGQTPAQVDITYQFTDPLPEQPFHPGNFDFSTDVETSFIHGGRYIYSDGSYSYTDGEGFNLNGINWAAFCDPEQNLNSSNGSGGWGSGGANYCDGGNSAGGSDSSGGFGW